MNQLKKRRTYYIFILNEYLSQTLGSHYPREIVPMIIMANYVPIKINCGMKHTTIIHDSIYIFGEYCNTLLVSQPYEIILNKSLSLINSNHGLFDRIALIETKSNKMYFWNQNPKKLSPDIIHLEWNVTEISCSDNCSIVLINLNNDSQKIYVWGSNLYGQLGLKNWGQYERTPQELILNEFIVKVVCGYSYMIALARSNKLYVWGRNQYGQLGLGHNTNQYSPQELKLCDYIMIIKCGVGHTVALGKSGIIYVWGHNDYGQLGLGYRDDQYTPQKLILNESISAIECGGYHTVALTNSGECYIWGSNVYGQLGLGDTQGRYMPQKLNLFGITSISCGGFHTAALVDHNKIFVWGSNDYGQLGLKQTDVNKPVEFKF